MGLARTAFCILSYTLSDSTTALSIIHSLIFQLIADDEDMRVCLCESAKEDAKRDLKSATNLLTTITNCVGTTYIIIDGLDEMNEPERKRLLKELISVSKSCRGVKILFSSRPESDINQS